MFWTIAIILVFLFVICITVFLAVINKSTKVKYVVCGITTMLVVAPLLSWCISTAYAVIEGTGFAGVAMMIVLFPILFLIGLVMLLVGVFKKFDNMILKGEERA